MSGGSLPSRHRQKPNWPDELGTYVSRIVIPDLGRIHIHDTHIARIPRLGSIKEGVDKTPPWQTKDKQQFVGRLIRPCCIVRSKYGFRILLSLTFVKLKIV